MAEMSQVLRVAVFKGADAALAQDYVGIAVGYDIFGAHQKLFDAAAQARASAGLGRPHFPRAFRSMKFCMLRGADLHHVGRIAPPDPRRGSPITSVTIARPVAFLCFFAGSFSPSSSIP